jgi:transposase-like protein
MRYNRSMETRNDLPSTLLEAIRFYTDDANCERTMLAIRFPNGPCCPRCGDTNVTKLSRPGVWKCNGCKKQYTLKVGTIFEDSPLPLSKWLPCVWLLAGAKNGISSCEVARALGVTQKTGWFMLHRVRHAMQNGSLDKPLSGEIEADETFIGGKEGNKHKSRKLNAGRGAVGKAVVAGILERDGQVRVSHVSDTSARVLQRRILDNVEAGSAVFTDAHGGYSGLDAEYMHAIVDHAVEYVRDNVHTNGLENFWSLLKRMIRGTYVAIDVPHLDAYLDEQSFRYNHRKDTDQGRFLTVLSMIAGKRLTYKDLIHNCDPYYLPT